MFLEPAETELTGSWVTLSGAVVSDSVCKRIEWLIKYALEQIAVNPESGGWEILFRDKRDGRYWERTYPHGESHGGGPPRLSVLAFEDARKKYGVGN